MSKRKIETLLQKLSSILSAEPTLSRLEKDLVKDYLRELYEIVVDMDESVQPRFDDGLSKRGFNTDQALRTNLAEERSFPLTYDQDPPPVEPIREDPQAPAVADSPKPKEPSQEIVHQKPESPDETPPPVAQEDRSQYSAALPTSDLTEEDVPANPIPTSTSNGHSSAASNVHRSDSDQAALHQPPSEVKENLRDIIGQSNEIPHKYKSLFSRSQGTELSDRLSSTPIRDLQKAFGINDKLLVINELFGGNRDYFNETLDLLNRKYSFDEAKSHLIRHIVDKYQWLDDQRVEGARQFIKLVERRFQQP